MTLVMTSLPLARVFQRCLHSRSFPLRADWQKSDSSVDREPQGNWNSNSIDAVSSSPSFSRPAARAPRRACSQATSLFAMELDRSKAKSLIHVPQICLPSITSGVTNKSDQFRFLGNCPPTPPLSYKINTYILSSTKC